MKRTRIAFRWSTSFPRRTVAAVAIAAVVGVAAIQVAAQQPIVGGPNVNIIGGPAVFTKNPQTGKFELLQGDPGQRQNEVSCFVDSRDPLDIGCAYNDYTPVFIEDINDTGATGDAWIGLSMSNDGGFTWIKLMYPGYPQDGSAEGQNSPLHGLEASADPTWVSGPRGTSFLSAISFNRAAGGTSTQGAQQGAVLWVQKYVNSNNVENDRVPFKRVGNPVMFPANSGDQFQDKPWAGVAPNGDYNLVWATFLGGGSSKPHSVIWRAVCPGGDLSKCTKTKLSEGDFVLNGTTLTFHAKEGWTDISYRRRIGFGQTQDTDAIMFVRCFDANTCTKPMVVVSPPNLVRSGDGSTIGALFDQGSGAGSPRNISNPAMAADLDKRVYIAYAQRLQGTDLNVVTRDSNILLTIGKADKAGNVTFSAPVVLDSLVTDGTAAQNPTFPGRRGHQFRPSMWFAAGKLYVSAAILHEDQTSATFEVVEAVDPATQQTVIQYQKSPLAKGELAPDPPDPDATERWRTFTDRLWDFAPQPPPGPNPFLDVAPTFSNATNPLKRRHTTEIGLWVGTPGLTGKGSGLPSFTFTNVWRSRIALRHSPQVPDEDGKYVELDANPWGLELFNQGKWAFAGDYDALTTQAFISNGTGTGFVPNTSPAEGTPVFVAWTDNRNVRKTAPLTQYNPAGEGCVDPSATSTRNQDIYMARAGRGLYVYAFGNQKPLDTLPAGARRAFAVSFQNAVNQGKLYRATAQSPGSWKQFGPRLASVNLSIPPFSMASRQLYAFSSANANATIRVDVCEIDSETAPTCKVGGLSAFTFINTDNTTPALLPPVGDNRNPNQNEFFTPDPLSPDPLSSNVNVTPDPLSPDPLSPDPLSPDPLSPDPLSPDPLSPDPLSPDPLSPDPLSPDPLSPDPLSPDPLSPDPLSLPTDDGNSVATDTLVKVDNKGNTSASLVIKTVNTKDLPQGSRLQVIVTQPYFTATPRGCELLKKNESPVLGSITDPTLIAIDDPNLQQKLTSNPEDASPKNLTVSVPPGGQINVIYRWVDPNKNDNITFTDSLGREHSIDPDFDPAADLITVPIAQPVSTPNIPPACDTATGVGCPTGGGVVAFPLRITTDSLMLAAIGRPYPPDTQVLTAEDGTAPYTWSVSALPGSTTALPAGLSLDSETGEISGTPTGPTGVFSFMVRVEDSSNPVRSASRVMSIEVIQPVDITTTSLAAFPATKDVAYAVTLNAINGIPFLDEESETSHYLWSITAGSLPPGLSINTVTGVISGTPTNTSTQAYPFEATATDTTPYSDTQLLCIVSSIPPPGNITATPLPAPDPDTGQIAQEDLDALANTLIGPGSGITISHVTFAGSNNAAGTFTGAAGVLGFNQGIILSSGFVTDVHGPNDDDATTRELGTGADSDLEALIPEGHFTLDRTKLEFDFVAAGEEGTMKTVTFQYVFSSDEYNEFVNSDFNDVFGFFIDGVNVGVVNGSQTPVSINTINGGNPFGTDATNPSFYRNNDPNDPGPATINIEADGLTVVLTITKQVTANDPHHMKLAIADAGDQALDSWVLIKAGSFKIDEICNNNVDDDNDGLVDADDPDCVTCGPITPPPSLQ